MAGVRPAMGRPRAEERRRVFRFGHLRRVALAVFDAARMGCDTPWTATDW